MGERLDVLLIVGNDSAPGHPVDTSAASGGDTFAFECGDICCGGEAVEGHVDEEGIPAGSSGAGGGVEAFPVGATGVVDVDVGVDEPGEDGVGAEIVDFGVGRDLIGRDEVENFFSFDEEGGGPDGVRSYDAA